MDGRNGMPGGSLRQGTKESVKMATQPAPPPPDRAEPIDPSIPGELPPVITPGEMPPGPEDLPETLPDIDRPGTSPSEVPGKA